MSNFAEATAVKAIDSHTYSVDLKEEWTIGSGEAIFTIQDKKIGGQTSVVHVSLTQDGNREEVVAYITHTNLGNLKGLTLDTQWNLTPPEVFPVDLTRLASHNEDENWVRCPAPFPKFRKAMVRYDLYIPRAGRQVKGVVDEWMKLSNGERFTDLTLGSVSDTFPLMVEGFMDSIREKLGLQDSDQNPVYWYPTLLLNLEIKKALPPEGLKWLFVRVQAKEIKDGRNDLDIIILDEQGDLVAVSHHVAMILDASRNLAKRGSHAQKSGGSSKI